MTEGSETTKRSWLALIVWVLVCLGAGGLGALVTTPEIPGWYRTIAKPSWNPPDAVFGPVWTTLFIMMGVAAWLVWSSGPWQQIRAPLTLFAVQLSLNVAWSWIFFGAHQIGWAVVEIIVLWIAIALTILAFRHRSNIAAWLLAPYLAWVTFATVLNWTIWSLN